MYWATEEWRSMFADALVESRKVRRALEAAFYAFAALCAALTLATVVNLLKAVF